VLSYNPKVMIYSLRSILLKKLLVTVLVDSLVSDMDK
jgi:hypothetical protein